MWNQTDSELGKIKIKSRSLYICAYAYLHTHSVHGLVKIKLRIEMWFVVGKSHVIFLENVTKTDVVKCKTTQVYSKVRGWDVRM